MPPTPAPPAASLLASTLCLNSLFFCRPTADSLDCGQGVARSIPVTCQLAQCAGCRRAPRCVTGGDKKLETRHRSRRPALFQYHWCICGWDTQCSCRMLQLGTICCLCLPVKPRGLFLCGVCGSRCRLQLVSVSFCRSLWPLGLCEFHSRPSPRLALVWRHQRPTPQTPTPLLPATDTHTLAGAGQRMHAVLNACMLYPCFLQSWWVRLLWFHSDRPPPPTPHTHTPACWSGIWVGCCTFVWGISFFRDGCDVYEGISCAV